VTLHYFKVSQATITGGKADDGGGGGASSLISGGNGGGDSNPEPKVEISEAVKAHSYNEAISTYLKDLDNDELQEVLFNLGQAG
jgi:hypothetical protein